MQDKYDIVVVGAGPAGLSAAYSAARNGASVIVLERDDGIAHNIRTSGVSWIDEMTKFGIGKEHYNPIRNYAFFSPSNEVMIRGNEPKCCVLNVRSTYQHLAFEAASVGAKIMVKANATNAIVRNDRISGVKINTPKGEFGINADLVIDASGFSTVVGRKFGFVSEWKRYGVGAEYECFAENCDDETWMLMVGNQYSPAGYAWAFPLGKNRIRIGVGIGRPESSEEPLDRLNSMLEKKPKPLDRMGKIEPVELHYGFIPNEGVRASTIADGFMLVGDSAGQANPLVLEGIRYAIEFGRLAGEIGSKALEKGATKESLQEYEQIWRSRVQSKIAAALRVQSRWLDLTDDEWDKEIDIIRDMSMDEFLDFIRADFSMSKMLKLALHHPKTAARQLFNMVLKS
ncbi:MAG: digeranylgeranylglycerophospholipid reductase [Candidatus Nitrosomirales archaeon]|jgi:digeranylgeranylglycerophospholipid reductase